MSISGVASFQARARAIDHLGRGQIADAPTAISELWKNAYDAYARNVELHIYDGDPSLAAVLDDGVGMNAEDILDRWLVIGTESKIENTPAVLETLGLPPRTRQGEKGIGRLSAAFLAPGTILVSKRSHEDYVVVLIDWRLFENPYLSLEDIKLPVETFSSPDELIAGLPGMLPKLLDNLGGRKDDRGLHLAECWSRFSEYETQQGTALTSNAIANCWRTMPLQPRHLEEWLVYAGLSDHGTAMYLIDLNNELAVWVRPDEAGEEVDEVKNRLRETLTAFTDPYLDRRIKFDYEVFVHRAGSDQRIIAANDVFGIDSLRDLEHHIEGKFDEDGVFTGRIVAFGKDLGEKMYRPKRAIRANSKDSLGPFSFVIGTFEQDEKKSTHDSNQHAFLEQQAERYSGIFVFRDGLRVMPYGRPNADFLGLEERRSMHAGRYFFSHRKSFGRISFSRQGNPHLRDKAGREGLVDNRAFREMRILLVEFLVDAARRYFGTDSIVRQESLPGIIQKKLSQRAVADKLKVARRKSMRQFLRDNVDQLQALVAEAHLLIERADDISNNQDAEELAVLASQSNSIRSIAVQLRPPTPPSKLGDLEEPWRDYRNGYLELQENLERLRHWQSELEAKIGIDAPSTVLERRINNREHDLCAQLAGYKIELEARLQRLSDVWREQIKKDQGIFRVQADDAIRNSRSEPDLAPLLGAIDALHEELSDKFASDYPSLISTIAQLIDGVDLLGAVDISNELREELEDQLNDIRAVAQIGVTVEIIGHEFETLESEVRRHLSRLPASVKSSPDYQAALSAHQALGDRLRFLAPMKIAGYRSREIISGEKIAAYVEEFFRRAFLEKKIDFSATDGFKSMEIVDIPSRIYPVFINLINNSVYWVSQRNDRRIVLDFQCGLAIVSDSGPGVDPDDVSRLFTLFFTTRRSGRGVGLFLSRANLAVAGHKIRYATPDDPRVLGGANFVIDFKGVRADV